VARVDAVRLGEIEAAAARARALAQERLSELGDVWDRDTDLRYVATVLAQGAVEAVCNLTIFGDRAAGALEWLLIGANIYYEAYDPTVRQRFSIAHELGHFFLHAQEGRRPGAVHADPPRSEDDEAEAILEWEADAFAAAFLMPAGDLRNDLIHFGQALSFLAERYRVAEAAMRRRLRTLEMLVA
jgi:hypothetical protein